MIKPVLCIDLDGPILDVSERYYRIYADFVDRFFLNPLPKLDYWQKKQQKISESVILSETGLSEKFKEYTIFRQINIEALMYLGFDVLWPGVSDLLLELSSEYKLYLVTLRANSDALSTQLNKLGIASRFDKVLCSGNMNEVNMMSNGHKKANMIRQSCGDDCPVEWIIGDTEAEIIAGNLLGSKTVAVSFGIRARSLLDSFDPDFLLETPSEFITWVKANILR